MHRIDTAKDSNNLVVFDVGKAESSSTPETIIWNPVNSSKQ